VGLQVANRLSRRRGLQRLRRPTKASAGLLLSTAYRTRFDARSGGRRAGQEDTASHYRKGVAGDWVDHFTPVHVEAFQERFGGLLDRLGYAEDWDRVAAPASG
jgi:hypothetical protein